MQTIEALDRGRDAFDRHAWAEARRELGLADGSSPLAPEDLERLATAAYLTGRDQESAEACARAHRGWLEAEVVERSARTPTTDRP